MHTTWKGMVRLWLLAILSALVCFLSRSAAGQQQPASAPSRAPSAQAPENASEEIATSPLPKWTAFKEDWNSISLADSSLVAQPLVPGDKVDLPRNSFIRELYQVQWRPGDPIDLYVIRPRGVTKPPVVLYLYG